MHVSVENNSYDVLFISYRQLQLLADGLVDHFVSNEIMDKEYESVKLHATLMNTIFNKQQGGVEDVRRRRSFNARDILKVS